MYFLEISSIYGNNKKLSKKTTSQLTFALCSQQICLPQQKNVTKREVENIPIVLFFLILNLKEYSAVVFLIFCSQNRFIKVEKIRKSF